MNNDIRGPVQPNQPGQPAQPEATVLSANEPKVINLQTNPDADPVELATKAAEQLAPARPARMSVQRLIGFGLIALAVVAAGLVALSYNFGHKGGASQQDTNAPALAAQSLSLGSVSQALASTQPLAASSVTVNGQLNVAGTLVMTPTARPVSAQAGQLYFDQTAKVLSYYNGTSFVSVTPGGNVTNNITNITNPPSVTNVTNVSGSNLAASGGQAGAIAMFKDASTLAPSMITQSGTSLSTGSGLEQVTLGSLAAGSSTLLQGGTGNLQVTTGPQTGSSGNISIQTGDSSTTAAGNINIDTGNSQLSGTVVATKDFEDGVDNMNDAVYGGNTTLAQTSAQAESGTHSLAITVGSFGFPEWGIGDGTGIPPFIIPATAGHTYAFQAWVKAGSNSDTITASTIWSSTGYGGGGEISQQSWGTVTDVSSGWRKVAGVLTAPVGSYMMGLTFFAYDATTIGEVHYLDNVTITDLSNSTASAAINIGSTNAQQITIGNSAMYAATAIYGGGINLNGGTGIMNLTSGNLVATAGGASLTTTSGALDIAAATTSTWKIAASGSTGGDLNIAAGAAGATGNGGSLNLAAGAAAGTGNSGNISITTANNAAASGNITIQTGTSTSTAAGSVTVDTGAGAVTGTLIADKTFDDGVTDACGTGNDDMSAWYSSSIAVSSAQAHSGANSLAVTDTTGTSWAIVQDDNCPGLPVVPGHRYYFSAWVRAGTVASNVGGVIYFGGIQTNPAPFTGATDSTTGWTQISGTAIAPAGVTTAWFEFSGSGSGAGTVHYFDDLTFTDLSASSSIAQLQLGATNAQAVTLGNANQIDATSLYGSGISLQAGLGNLIMAGGAASLTSDTGISLAAATSTTIKSTTNSTTAFQLQDSGGNALLTQDSANDVLTASGNVVVRTASACNSSGYASAITALSPAAYWKLDDTGTTAADSSGNNDTGTLSAVTTGQTPGPISCNNSDPAMGFSGSSQITTATSAPSPAVYTEVAMFKTTSTNGTLLGYSNGTNHDRELGLDSTGHLQARIYNTSAEYVTSSQVVNDGAWHTAAVTLSAAGMDLYLDGTLVASNPGYTTTQSYTGSWWLGGGWGINEAPYTGQLAQVAVFSTALTSPQIQSLAAKAGFYNYSTAAICIGTSSPAANLDDAGTALFHAPVNAPNALQIQNASGTALFTADTTNYAIVLGSDGTPQPLTVRGGAATGTNAAGANLTFDGSNGTGGANGGDIVFRTAQAAQGGIQLDTSAETTGTSPLNLTITVGNNADRLLIGEVPSSATAVSYDGVAMTKLGSVTSPAADGSGSSMAMWYLVAPPAGTHAVTATYPSGSAVIGAVSYYNVDQTSPFGALVSSSGTASGTQTESVNVTTTSASQVVVDGFATDKDTVDPPCTTTNPGQTIVWSIYQSFVSTTCGSQNVGTSGTTTETYQVTTADWALAAVPLNPAVPGSLALQAVTGTSADALNDRLHITATGDVGIDNASPQHTLDVAGDALFKNALDSTSAFQIQNASGTPLLIADTKDMTLTVTALSVTGNLTVNGHIITGGTTPTVVAGAAACTAPTVSVAGTDTAGTLTVTAGTSCPGPGVLATVTFAASFGASPHIVVSPASQTAAGLQAYVDNATATTTTFDLDAAAAPTSGTTYVFNYWAAQ